MKEHVKEYMIFIFKKKTRQYVRKYKRFGLGIGYTLFHAMNQTLIGYIKKYFFCYNRRCAKNSMTPKFQQVQST